MDGQTIKEIKDDISELKNLLKFYHGEPNRKLQINEIIQKIECKIEN